jgi:hypothetical protein
MGKINEADSNKINNSEGADVIILQNTGNCLPHTA